MSGRFRQVTCAADGNQNILNRLNVVLSALKDYILEHGGHSSVSSIKLQWSDQAERDNINDPRVFCHTIDGSSSIYCSLNLCKLPTENIVGILIHEIGHIVRKQASDAGREEVECDLWVKHNYPEIGYEYEEAVIYEDWGCRETRIARSIQKVGALFMEWINERI
jgi:hypothetical protein